MSALELRLTRMDVQAGVRPHSKSMLQALSAVSDVRPTVVLRRKRAHTGFSFDHPGRESHFAEEVSS